MGHGKVAPGLLRRLISRPFGSQTQTESARMPRPSHGALPLTLIDFQPIDRWNGCAELRSGGAVHGSLAWDYGGVYVSRNPLE